jgi:predicted DCC family thiol-disulfide oxidoreductase YuxK
MGEWRFYYDGNCTFCTRVVAVLSRTGWRGGVAWVPFQSLAAPPTGLTWSDLEQAAYLDTGEVRLHQGFFAFRKLSVRLPLLIPLAPLLWFPGMSLLGAPVYRWIARNRYRISHCRIPGLKPSRDGE